MTYTPLTPFNNTEQLQFSFPMPVQGTVVRASGEGCISCVHGTYCPALYWFNREVQNDFTEQMGIACTSFSSNPVDKIGAPNSFDKQENDYRNDQGFLREAKPGGYSDANTTGIWKHDPIDID